MTKIYVLCGYRYDHYEWEYTFATSFDKEKLVEYFKTNDSFYGPLAKDEQEHDSFSCRKEPHYLIRQINFIGDTPQTDTVGVPIE